MNKVYQNDQTITIDTLNNTVSCKFNNSKLTLSSNNITDILFYMIDKFVDMFLVRPKLVYI